ncbi:MAG: NAD-dependent DNA ligase LigA [Patescibacteria group bacterium]|nr:NAD-dependent DNA ligase LigA [Patescibacteria group bacterium]
MTKQEAKKRIDQLKEAINHHRYLYHVLDKQEISEAALDSLKHELLGLEREYPDLVTSDSPTQRVEGKPLDRFRKVRHETRMLSMEDVFSSDELEDWNLRISKHVGETPEEYYVELKMDGLAVSLVYEDGLLAVGATRGDGEVGEDVLNNLKTVEAIPLRLRRPEQKEVDAFIRKFGERLDVDRFREVMSGLAGRIEVRGEVFMPKGIFDRLNVEQEKAGQPLFANPRNAAAGSIRQLDPAVARQRGLDFFGYALLGDLGLGTHEQAHELMKLLGVKINPLSIRVESPGEIGDHYRKIHKKRDRLPYWIDGIVVVVNDDALFGRLGVVGKAPRGSVAFKFPAEQATTVIEDIRIQVGRTGALTPVAVMRPVKVAGTTVTHSTLHNMDEIGRLGVMIGDTVVIEKAGDIIPKVIRVIEEARNGDERKFRMPKKCPFCGSAVRKDEGGVAHYCANKDCYARSLRGIMHFISKGGIDADGVGGKMIEKFMEEGLVRDAADLFTLTEADLTGLEGFGKKSAENVIVSIKTSRKVPLGKFIYALGIRHVGTQTAMDLADEFRGIEALREAPQERMASVEGVGPIVAESVAAYFSDKKNSRLVDRLLEYMEVQSVSGRKTAGPLTGKTFVLTGTMRKMTRNEAKDRIRVLGGKVVGSVSGSTDFLVVGESPGSKLDKAKKFGVTVLKEPDFLAMVMK